MTVPRLIAVVAFAFLQVPLMAQQPEFKVRPNGFDIFKRIILNQGLTPLKVDDALKTPSTTVMIVLDMPVHRQLALRLEMTSRTVLENGGAVLIATHRRVDLSNYFNVPAQFSVAIEDQTVVAPGEWKPYLASPDIPFLKWIKPPIHNPDLGAMPRLKNVATYKPGRVSTSGSNGWLTPFSALSMTGGVIDP
jgi:hypothetical protein